MPQLFLSFRRSLCALTLAVTLSPSAYAVTQINCYGDDRPVKLTLGKEKIPLTVPRNQIAYPRDPEKTNLPFLVLAANMEDGSAVCRAKINDVSKKDFQLHLTPGDSKLVENRLSALLKNEYPVKVADNEKGFIVWRSLYTTLENQKTYYYELMVPNEGALSFDGYIICAGQSITGSRLDRELCTVHEAYAGMFMQYKFVASNLSKLEKLHVMAQQIADKALGNPKE